MFKLIRKFKKKNTLEIPGLVWVVPLKLPSSIFLRGSVVYERVSFVGVMAADLTVGGGTTPAVINDMTHRPQLGPCTSSKWLTSPPLKLFAFQ